MDPYQSKDMTTVGMRAAAIVFCAVAGVLLVALLVVAFNASACVQCQQSSGDSSDPSSAPSHSSTLTGATQGTGSCLHTVKSETEIDTAIQKAPVIVMFHATWCGSCKVTMPIVQQLAGKSPYTVLAMEASYITPTIKNKYKVTAFPTFVQIDQGGSVADSMRGGGDIRVARFLGINDMLEASGQVATS